MFDNNKYAVAFSSSPHENDELFIKSQNSTKPQEKCPLILITGSPGVGKTTIIKKLINDLKNSSVQLSGFYTEEIRNNFGQRDGFDIVSINGGKDILARKSEHVSCQVANQPRIGRYCVFLENFENIALPVFSVNNNLLILDEIGNMELLSIKFEKHMKEIMPQIQDGSKPIIATIPLSNRKENAVVKTLKSIKNAAYFEISKTNRNSIYSTILNCALNMRIEYN